ncbi:MAG TPA: hypothetical protein VK869_16135 [Rubrobacteraceae bacterium]|nr:hypothetical protein [Rubrobacteraceae bacterium]
MVKDAQHTARATVEYAAEVQEINTEIARKTNEIWLKGLRKQTDLSRKVIHEFLEKAQEQRGVYAEGVFDPFAFWREWTHRVQEATRDAEEVSARTAREARESAGEQASRAVEATVPSNGSFPIAGYDEKSVEEISRRLDTLTSEQLRRVKDYERRNKNRETLLQQIDRRIAADS